MEAPAYLIAYWALVALIAVPASFFSRIAAVLVAVRLLSQIAWNMGMPEPQTQVLIYIIAACAALRWAETFPCRLIAVLFAPLAVAAAASGVPGQAVGSYWTIYAIAVVQVLLVPLCIDWRMVREGIQALRDLSWIDRFLRVSAWTW